MTENSYLWSAPSGAGDGAASFTRTDWSNIMRVIAACQAAEGVAAGYLNALVGSTTGVNNARIGTGGALVDGKPYFNNAAIDTTIPSASGGGNTRIDRIVLRADWTAQTVRVTRIAGVDAASPTAPAITQNTGVVYDVLLIQALVNTAGTVTITDERTFAQMSSNNSIANSIVSLGKLATLAAKSVMGNATAGTAAVTAITGTAGQVLRISDDGTTLAFSNLIPQFYRRQGGDPTDWGLSAGSTTYTPTAVRMQGGSTITTGGGVVTVTFPVAFSGNPIVLLTPIPASSAKRIAMVSNLSATILSINLTDNSGAAVAGEIVNWLAIGPT